jgi:hypothetical protein
MDSPSFARGEQITLIGTVAGFIGSILPWGGATSGIILRPSGGALVALIVATGAGIVVLLRDWTSFDRLVVAIGGGLLLGVVARTVLDLHAAGGAAPGFGLYLVVLAGICLLSGGALDFLTAEA